MRVANQAALQELAERIDQADAVVIGGGSGLSIAESCQIILKDWRKDSDAV